LKQPKVVVLGGGVAGMSAAHELVERGFEVEVYELRTIPGGKARSLPAADPSARGKPSTAGPMFAGRRSPLPRPLFPGEHGFRFFPGFYRHIVDTMARIPFGDRTVADNLVDTTQVHIARFGKPPVYYPARFPQGPGEVPSALKFVIGLLTAELDVPPEETALFVERMFQIMSSCEERRLAEYEQIGWWDFVQADQRSLGYQKFFANGFTRSLVAAKAERASTRTIGDIFIQMVLSAMTPPKTADRLLDGPTNDVWINPWLRHLTSSGVSYHFGAQVVAITPQAGAIRSATVIENGARREITGDYFVCALPVERLADLVTPELEAAEPALGKLAELSEYVEWMNGIMFYLTEDRPLVHGHSIYMDTPWALTSVSQAQFWPHYDLSTFGDGKVRGILSVCISDWDVEGLNGKQADDCTRDEIKAEVWEELKRSVNVGGQEVLRDDLLHYWFLDPSIEDTDPVLPGYETNAEPLLVNYVDTWRLRPEAVTAIPNFFLASDYVRTHTDIATMEGANEAARRAVNGVLAAARSAADPCGVWKLHEPEIFAPLRAYDRERFVNGLPWDGRMATVGEQALGAASVAPPGRVRIVGD
jgi:uncharacterized protein with NAD-binding domain and iron-sulfur cluster